MCRIGAALFLAVTLATPAEAQELAVALSIYGPFGINDLDGKLPPSLEFRFTVPLSNRFSLEPFVTVGSSRDRRSAGPEGFYGAQIRQRIGGFGKDVYPFASYGAAAYYSRVGFLHPSLDTSDSGCTSACRSISPSDQKSSWLPSMSSLSARDLSWGSR